MNKPRIGEVLVDDLKTKQVYNYIDESRGINVKSREVYKNRNVIVYYPFGRDGSPKYEGITKITLIDTPKAGLRGFSSAPGRGYGFTKTLSRLAKVLFEGKSNCEVIIGPKEQNEITKSKIRINSNLLDVEFPKFSSLIRTHNKEIDNQARHSLNKLFPSSFALPRSNYKSGSLDKFIRVSGVQSQDLSDKDVNAILELTKNTSQSDLMLNQESVLQARERIEKFYIETVIEEYEALLKQGTATISLEEKWQQFFRKYNWIFSQLFTAAVLYFSDKAYVGGKTIDNKNGKIADFIYKNALTDNVSIIEIKTHKTQLVLKQTYRGNDVYSIGKELSGAINQVLDQRDNLQKEYYDLDKKSQKSFETFNSECIIVAGSLKGMSSQHKKAFELQRSNSKDVRIVTFDEVLVKLKGLRKLITGK